MLYCWLSYAAIIWLKNGQHSEKYFMVSTDESSHSARFPMFVLTAASLVQFH